MFMNNKDPNKKLIDLINYTIADTNYKSNL